MSEPYDHGVTEEKAHFRQVLKGNKMRNVLPPIERASTSTPAAGEVQACALPANDVMQGSAVGSNPGHSNAERSSAILSKPEHPVQIPNSPSRIEPETSSTISNVREIVRASTSDHATNARDIAVEALSAQKNRKHVEARVIEFAPTQEGTLRMARCLSELNRAAQYLGDNWEVHPFGSFANGFATFSSDLDVTLLTTGCTNDPATVLRDWFLPNIMHFRVFAVKDVILTARIPLLKLSFEDSLDVDVSCHNPTPLLNTKLLAAYSRVDHRIQQLGVAVKIWAKGAGVCDARKSNLSSYSFTLLVLYFLQVHAEVGLPPISVEAVTTHSETYLTGLADSVSDKWRCRLPLADLLTKFFEFYTNDFSWGDEVASVRCAARLVVTDPEFANLRGKHVKRLHIEDPFQLDRNLHAVLGDREEHELRHALSDAFAQMSAGQTPSALIPLSGQSGSVPEDLLGFKNPTKQPEQSTVFSGEDMALSDCESSNYSSFATAARGA